MSLAVQATWERMPHPYLYQWTLVVLEIATDPGIMQTCKQHQETARKNTRNENMPGNICLNLYYKKFCLSKKSVPGNT